MKKHLLLLLGCGLLLHFAATAQITFTCSYASTIEIISGHAFTNDDTFNELMVRIPAGTFSMGSNDRNSYEQPIHTVSISSFYMSKYEVTQKQWRDIMGTNPSYFKDCDNCPVENVSWNGIQDFLQKLNAKTGKNYSLPTEAEWEYAARGGQSYAYAGSDDLDNIAWYWDIRVLTKYRRL